MFRNASPSSLPPALLLAGAGGLIDAVVYLNDGHVFANAMTGNMIFLGIAIVSRDFSQIAPHLAPLPSFLAGIYVSKLLRTRMLPHAATVALVLEIVALFLIGFLPPDFPKMALVGIVAFVCAFQVSTFRAVGRFQYNSTIVTGNLRDLTEGLYDHFNHPDPAKRYLGRAKAQTLAAICFCFLCGVIVGAWLAPRFTTHALWFAEPLLLTVLLFTILRPADQTKIIAQP